MLCPRPPGFGAPLLSARIICSAAQLLWLGSRARTPRGGGKLASVVTITNSIVLSRTPANKVIHYGPLPATVGCAAISGPRAAPSRAKTRASAVTCRDQPAAQRPPRCAPRPSRSGAGGSSSRSPISFISERQLTYTDWLPAAKCQLNCKCSAEAQRGARWQATLPEGTRCCSGGFDSSFHTRPGKAEPSRGPRTFRSSLGIGERSAGARNKPVLE